MVCPRRLAIVPCAVQSRRILIEAEYGGLGDSPPGLFVTNLRHPQWSRLMRDRLRIPEQLRRKYFAVMSQHMLALLTFLKAEVWKVFVVITALSRKYTCHPTLRKASFKGKLRSNHGSPGIFQR